ncbi:uncharacterized protein LOC131881707 [Tigriopus californicus]|uniref:uncharacterized protein LOC131881707 n=1 Tax=Tigriopus californicus TaxID=6832 RepID=UPI0027DA273E|nr:uncharacterized protein LOC131881707 [Tigriopus californicus]
MSPKSAYKEKKVKKSSKETPGKGNASNTWPCKVCGMSKEKHGNKCFAVEVECLNCQKIGHYKQVCPLLSKGARGQQNCLTLSSISKVEELIPLTTHLGKFTKVVEWLPDSGAFCNAMSLQDLENLGGATAQSSLTKSAETLMAADRSPLKTRGTIRLVLERGDLKYKATVYVLDQTTAPLLSKSGCVALGLLPEGWPKIELYTSMSNEQNCQILHLPHRKDKKDITS